MSEPTAEEKVIALEMIVDECIRQCDKLRAEIKRVRQENSELKQIINQTNK
jgi:hypothetical protein